MTAKPLPAATTVPAEVPPSPQVIVAVKSLTVAKGLASLKVATVTPVRAASSVPVSVAPAAVSAASRPRLEDWRTRTDAALELTYACV